MPIMECSEDGKAGFKYGESGKCYTHDGSEGGMKAAREKAEQQAAAIEANRKTPRKDIETRIWKPVEELRISTGEDGRVRVRGLAVPYGQLSEDLGGFREEFLPGALADSIRTDDIRGDVEHERIKLLGRSSKGTLGLSEDRRGVWAEITLPKTSLGADVAEDIRNGNYDGMSIAFADAVDDYHRHNGDLIRKVKKATLRAVTLTSFPAYKQTVGTLALRSLEEFRQAEEAEAAKIAEEAKAAALEADKIERDKMRMALDLEEVSI